MMLSHFTDIDMVAVVITDPSAGTMVNGIFTPGTTSLFNGKGWCWKNRAAVNFNETSYAVAVSYTVVLRASEVTTAIKDTYNLTVDGVSYKIENVDNIAFQGEAILMTCYRTGQNG
jgi:hypothetical protein